MPAVLLVLLKALAVHFVIHLILSFGLAFVTYYGFTEALNYLKSGVISALGELPKATFDLLMIMGVGKGLSYVFGAMTFYAAMKATAKLRFKFYGD